MAKGRKKTQREVERNREYQKEYYQRRREELLAERRRRYREDPEYRERMRIRDRRRYWFGRRQQKKKRSNLPDVDFNDVQPLGKLRIVVKNPKDLRHGQEVEVPVYGTNELGQFLGRDGQTIRKWLKRGVLPESAHRGAEVDFTTKGRNPRLYTEDEARIIYENRELLERPAPSLADSAFSRTVTSEFGKLVQGLRPKPRRAKDLYV